jgi:oligosaccharide repeat unit polymerase
MNILLAVLFSLLTLIGAMTFRRTSWVSPVIGFLFFNWIMGVGLIPLLELDNRWDRQHLLVVMLTPVLFCMGAFSITNSQIYRKACASFRKRPLESGPPRDLRIVSLGLLASVVVSAVYYQLVGYNLTGFIFSSDVEDFTSLRLSAYSGEAYTWAGYVNQFKNTLFPVCVLYCAMSLRGRSRAILLTVMIPLLLYFLLGTGQRTYLVLSLLIVSVAIYIARQERVPKNLLLALLIPTVVVFSLLSVRLGRTSEFSLLETLNELFHRTFVANQTGAWLGFRFVAEQGVQYGKEWLDSLVALLPGVRGSGISHEIHAEIYGSTRGTAPLGIWGSAFYNFGFIGPLLLAFFMGLAYAWAHYSLICGPKSTYRVVFYAALFTYLATWIAGGPTQLLNNGVGMVVLMLALRKIHIGRAPRKQSRAYVSCGSAVSPGAKSAAGIVQKP